MRIESLADLLKSFPDSDNIWSNKNPFETEQEILSRFPDPLAIAPEDFGVFFQLCRALGLQGKAVEAQELLVKSSDLIALLPDQYRLSLRIGLLLEQGRMHCLEMAPSKAQNYFYDAWLTSVRHEETFYTVESAFLLSICQSLKNKKVWLQRALNTANETADPRTKLWCSHLYLQEGWHYFDLRLYQEAIKSFSKALLQPRSVGETSDLQAIRWSLARSFRAVGEYQEAEDILWDLNKEIKNLGKRNGYVYLEIAECLQLTHKIDDAKIYFEFAYQELSVDPWYSSNKVNELNRIKHLYKSR